jgi:hypothetical protein
MTLTPLIFPIVAVSPEPEPLQAPLFVLPPATLESPTTIHPVPPAPAYAQTKTLPPEYETGSLLLLSYVIVIVSPLSMVPLEPPLAVASPVGTSGRTALKVAGCDVHTVAEVATTW